jgi:hypothetical protein
VEGLGGEVEGGWRARGVKKACDGAKREEGGGSARRPFSGRRHAREEGDGGWVRSARGHMKVEGGLAAARARAGGPGHEQVWSGGGSPGTRRRVARRGGRGREREG